MTTQTPSEPEVRAHIAGLIRQLTPDGFPPDGPQPGGGTPVDLVDDLGYNSLALLELAFAVEDDFDLPPIDEETGRKLRTDVDIADHVVAQLRDLGRVAEGPA